MKKNLLFTILISSFSFYAHSQLWMMMPDSSETGAVSSDIECYQGDTLINTSSSNPLTIDVVRVQNVTTAGWSTAFCLNVCYLPSTDSVRFTIPANSKQGFIVHFYTSSTPSSGMCYFKFKNVNTPTNTYYKHFYVTSVNGVFEETNNANVKIYPNPISTDATIEISNLKSSVSNFEFAVYDVYGRKVKNQNIQSSVFKIECTDLPAGVYSYSLISENQKLNSGKIIVNR